MKLFTGRRLHDYPILAAIASFVGLVSFGVRGMFGDFRTFWPAGRLVLEGRGDELWNFPLQWQLQQQAFPGHPFLPFPYSPPVAAAYAPFAALPPHVAWFVHAGVMVLMLWVAIIGLERLLPPLRPWRLAAFSAAFAFPPLLVDIAGGQNTALLLALVVWAFVGFAEDRPLVSGLVVGALVLFKPQYGLALGLIALTVASWRLVAAGAFVGVVGWIVGAAVTGADWVGAWLRASAYVDHSHSTSIVEPLLTQGALGTVLAVVVAAAVAWGVSRLWPGLDWPQRLAVTIPAMLLIAPHAHLGNLGVLTASYAVVVVRAPDLRPWLAVLTLGGYSIVAWMGPGWSGLLSVLLAAGSLGLVYRAISGPQRAATRRLEVAESRGVG